MLLVPVMSSFTLLQFLLNLLFPQKLLVRELLRMEPAEFASRVGKAAHPPGKGVISCFDYHDALVRQAVWELKYRGNKKIARLLGAALYDELLAFLEEYAPLMSFTEPLLVPIPLSKARESKRGFNQCELLADVLVELDCGRNFTLSHGLAKIKDTPSQTKSDTRKKRLENLKDCFAADEGAVKSRNIILIDDVVTTGATLTEARKTLLRAGARKVIAFTVAH